MRYILIILFLTSSVIYPGKSKFEKISVEQGLSQSIIITVFQDSKGYLWIGTQEGLNKYDGYKFTHYKNDPVNNNTISDNYVRKILEDTDNNLWIATNEGGLNKFNRKNNKFSSYKHDENNPASLSDNNITDLLSDSAGNFWIGTYHRGLDYFDKQKQKFTNYYKKENSLIDNHITALYYDRTGKYLWVGTYGGLNLLDINTGKFIDLNKFLFKNNKPENYWIRDILQDKNNNVWIATDTEGLFKINNFTSHENLSAKDVKNFKYNASVNGSISGNSINSICETAAGDIYLGIWGGGLNKIIEDRKTGKTSFQAWLKNPKKLGSITENDINVVMEDRSGVLWIGTYGDGLNKLTPHSPNFTHYKYNPFTKNSLTDNQVTSVLEDNNILWIGTWNGLNKLDKKKNIFTHFNQNSRQENSISGNRVTSIIKDKNGILWIGTLNNGLNKYNPETGKFLKFINEKENPKSISTNRILSLLETKDGRIWIGTYYGGVNIYSPSANSFEKLDTKNIDNFDGRVTKIFEDSDGNIWIGTYKGTYKYYPKRNLTERIRFKNELYKDFFASGVLDIAQDAAGNIWIGSFGNGVYKLTQSKDDGSYEIKLFDEKNGLPNNYVYALQFDSSGNFWISTRNGLAKLNNDTEMFETFTNYEGVEFTEFSAGSFFNKGTGNLYFCSMQGLLEFNPEKINILYSKPQIEITQLKIFNKLVNVETYLTSEEPNDPETIVLNYDENSIALEFAALDFISPLSIKYKYKLEGFDEQFITAEPNNRVATYTNLPSGQYLFKIVARLGAQAGYEKNILINVIPPFWEKAWFRILILISVLLILYAVFTLRTVKIRQRNEELQKEVRLRTRELENINAAKDKFFSIIAHDLKGPFSYLLNNSEFLAKEVHNISKDDTGFLASNINMATSNIYNLLENLLQWSKFQMMGIKPEPHKIDLTEVVINNVALVAPHAEQKQITLEKTIQTGVEIFSDENIINTILRNLLMNAIKFTRENGKITVTTKAEDNHVIIRVSDTGIGMDKNQINEILASRSVVSSQGTKNERGTGLGLYLIKEFIEGMNGKLNIESKKNEGTAVTCYIPYK